MGIMPLCLLDGFHSGRVGVCVREEETMIGEGEWGKQSKDDDFLSFGANGNDCSAFWRKEEDAVLFSSIEIM